MTHVPSQRAIPHIDYRTAGTTSRPCLTLLHAGGMTHEEWAPHLEALARHFHVIALSAPGHGASERIDTLSFELMAARVLELLDHLGIESTHLAGSSMGGVTSLFLAIHHAARVDRLILYRANYHTDESMREALYRMKEPETWQQWGLDGFLRSAHEPQGGPEAWREVTRRVIELVDPDRASHQFSLDDLRSVRARTLVIGGDRDPIVPLDDLQTLHHEIPRSALWVVPGGTHVLAFEGWRRETFQREIVHFLTRP